MPSPLYHLYACRMLHTEPCPYLQFANSMRSGGRSTSAWAVSLKYGSSIAEAKAITMMLVRQAAPYTNRPNAPDSFRISDNVTLSEIYTGIERDRQRRKC